VKIDTSSRTGAESPRNPASLRIAADHRTGGYPNLTTTISLVFMSYIAHTQKEIPEADMMTDLTFGSNLRLLRAFHTGGSLLIYP
jgi:hypothetical protein